MAVNQMYQESSIFSEQKNVTGITLIALVITIVILLVLAGVVINLSMGENGIIGKAKTAVDKYKEAAENEQIELAKFEDLISGNRNISKTELVSLLKEIMEEEHIDTTPTGTIISYMGNNVPNGGYLKCDGTVYNILDYPKLATQIENEFGSKNHFGGDGETTFAVPNLQGEFLRGTGQSEYAGAGPGGAVGEHQRGSIVNGTYSDGSNFGVAYSASTIGDSTAFGWGQLETNVYPDKFYSAGSMRHVTGYVYSTSDSSSMVRMGRYTVRPTNTSVLYCIKY